jgi:hypothetical protein
MKAKSSGAICNPECETVLVKAASFFLSRFRTCDARGGARKHSHDVIQTETRLKINRAGIAVAA